MDDVRMAAERRPAVAHLTPVLSSRTLDGRTGATVLCKAENLQRAGTPHTIANRQQVETAGALTFEVNRRQIEEILLVEDKPLIEAMAFLSERLKIVVEPLGASALAAVLGHSERFAARRVGVLSGGNVDVERFTALIAGARS